jgi:hypothetical protein
VQILANEAWHMTKMLMNHGGDVDIELKLMSSLTNQMICCSNLCPGFRDQSLSGCSSLQAPWNGRWLSSMAAATSLLAARLLMVALFVCVHGLVSCFLAWFKV